jgi:hypothetical protein
MAKSYSRPWVSKDFHMQMTGGYYENAKSAGIPRQGPLWDLVLSNGSKHGYVTNLNLLMRQFLVGKPAIVSWKCLSAFGVV